MGRGGRPAAVCDQRAELRPLQNLRHQGPQPQHHLGAAGGRRGPEILEYVMAVPPPVTIPPHGNTLGGLRDIVAFHSLREDRKRAILRPTRRAGVPPPMEAATRDCSYFVPAP